MEIIIQKINYVNSIHMKTIFIDRKVTSKHIFKRFVIDSRIITIYPRMITIDPLSECGERI